MFLLKNPLSLVVLLVALVGLVLVVLGSVLMLVSWLRRGKLRWARGTRMIAGIGGVGLPVVVMIVPPVISWIVYLTSTGKMDAALADAAPDQRAAMMARAVESAMAVSAASAASMALLALPCALLVGLALTVPFYLKLERDEEEA